MEKTKTMSVHLFVCLFIRICDDVKYDLPS